LASCEEGREGGREAVRSRRRMSDDVFSIVFLPFRRVTNPEDVRYYVTLRVQG
jgi:hypothetical protein